jgi:hypothetical protein
MTRASSLLSTAAALAILTAMPQAQGSNAANAPAPTRPAGVPAADWVPISRNLGFVIEEQPDDRTEDSIPAVKGYFVVRQGARWLRVEPAAPLAHRIHLRGHIMAEPR